KGGGQRFVTPGATGVIRAGEHGFWLLGHTALYAWDGRELRRAETPLHYEARWRSPAGEVWLAGADRTATLKGAGEGVPAGAVIRLPSPGDLLPAARPAQGQKP